MSSQKYLFIFHFVEYERTFRSPEYFNNRWKHWSSEKMILDNRRITIREFADDAGISFSSCQAGLMSNKVTYCLPPFADFIFSPVIREGNSFILKHLIGYKVPYSLHNWLKFFVLFFWIFFFKFFAHISYYKTVVYADLFLFFNSFFPFCLKFSKRPFDNFYKKATNIWIWNEIFL